MNLIWLNNNIYFHVQTIYLHKFMLSHFNLRRPVLGDLKNKNGLVDLAWIENQSIEEGKGAEVMKEESKVVFSW